jgi:PAS domain S-box-containing protein
LVQENNHLKSLAQSLDPAVGKKIISECCSELPDIVKAVSSNNEQTSMLGQADFSLISAICSAQRSFCISDPALPDNPLVFASQGFLDLTGYTMDEVLGRNCRFLQGPQTDLAGIAVLGQGIAEGVDTSVMLLNYKKDGTTFWNQIYCSALRDSDDNIVNYVGVQIEVLPSELENAQASDKQSQKKPKLS